MKMRIIHLLSSNIFSGAENVACQIIDLFKSEKNYEMMYCSPNGSIKEVLKEKNIEYIPINKLNKNNLDKIIKKYKPDYIHAHDVKASIIASLFKSECNIISHIHVNNNNMSKLNLKTLIYNNCTKNFDHIFWVSKSCFDSYIFKEKIINKSSILYNIINEDNVRERANLESNTLDYEICYLGRLAEQKDPLRLIEILRNIIEKRTKTKCVIIGEGVLKEQVQNKIMEYGLEKNIKLLGFQKNPLRILKNSKVLIMTSKFEGTPMCALEAMALGVPIVSTPTDGMNELVDNGLNGYLSDKNEIIEKNILNIIDNPLERSKLSKNCFNKSKKINNLNNYKRKLIIAYGS